GVYDAGTSWSVAGSFAARLATSLAAEGSSSSTTRLAGNGFAAVVWAMPASVESCLASASACSLLRYETLRMPFIPAILDLSWSACACGAAWERKTGSWDGARTCWWRLRSEGRRNSPERAASDSTARTATAVANHATARPRQQRMA